MREAMGELNGVPATNSTPAPVQPVKPAVVTPVPTQPAVTPAKPVVQPPVVTPMVKPMPTTGATTAPTKIPPTLSPEAEMKARAALHQAEMESGSATSAPAMAETMPVPTKATRSGAKPVYANTPVAAQNPLTVPPPQLSGSKEQRLQILASQYKSDQISAKDYHEQKAKILAEP